MCLPIAEGYQAGHLLWPQVNLKKLRFHPVHPEARDLREGINVESTLQRRTWVIRKKEQIFGIQGHPPLQPANAKAFYFQGAAEGLRY